MKVLIFTLLFLEFAFAAPRDSKVINGVNADIKDFPSMVSIDIDGNHTCGGTILNDWWILTAAHCVAGVNGHLSIEFGVTKLYSNMNNYVNVDAVYWHEAFSSADSYKNDIAVIKVASPINNTLANYKVKLATNISYYTTGAPSTLIGWGYTKLGVTADILQKVDLPVYSCSDSASLSISQLYPTHVCAGVPGSKGQCSGDSGGPLFVNGAQIGIVSWSFKPCAIMPGVFTAVAPYISWIQQKTGINFTIYNSYVQA